MRSPRPPGHSAPARLVAVALLLAALTGGAAAGAVRGDGYGRARRLYMKKKVLGM
jgi:hypothetical protein